MGGGLGSLAFQNTQAHPTLVQAGLPPSDVRADGQRDLHKSWVGLGFWTALAWAGQGLLPWLCSLHPFPQTPPLLHHPAPDFRPSLLKDVWKSGAGWRRQGEGLGATIPVAGSGRVLTTSTSGEAGGGGQNPDLPKTGA